MLPKNLKTVLEALCRIGLGAQNPAFRHQVERLVTTLREEGHGTEAAAIQRLLTNAGKTAGLQPSRVEVAQAFAGTEPLGIHTAIPADKETGAPLAEVRFPQDPSTDYPVLEGSVAGVIRGLAEEWRHMPQLAQFGVVPAQTCLIYGLPGTGKTRIAHALSDELRLPLVLARLDGLVSSFLGTTARNIANLFQFANRYRCILLLDEFDAVAKLRDDPHEVGEIKRVVNSILQNIDLRKGRGITLAITNHERLLDPAIWRRFEVRVLVPSPPLTGRIEIARGYFAPLALDAVSEAVIGWATEGMTGADIESVAKAVKRTMALDPAKRIIDGLRYCAVANASGGNYPNFSKLLEPSERLARILSDSTELNLSQRDIAGFLGTNQAQVSRWVRQPT